MQVNYRGTKMVASNALLTSVANVEIITSGTVFNFAFMNDAEVVVIVNGVEVFLRSEQGLFVDVVNSFKIKTSGVTYNYVSVLA